MGEKKTNKKRRNSSNSSGLPRVACMGGGNAMPKAVLTGLKKRAVKLSAICAMLDSGGSSGRLRQDYKIVSPGDIRRAFIALANTSPVVEKLFNYRFQAGQLKGHNFANLFITALELSSKNNYDKVCDEMSRILNVEHEVLPVTLENSHLYAVLDNDKVISGETNIDIPKHDGGKRIKDVFLKPKAKAYPKAIKAIQRADLVVIGPGDLYSSLTQILLVEGIPKALRKSKAKKIYVCNLMTKHGETNGFTVLDFSREIEKRLEEPLDYVIYNTQKPSSESVTLNRELHPELLEMVPVDPGLKKNKKFIGANLLASKGEIIHTPENLAKIILSLL